MSLFKRAAQRRLTLPDFLIDKSDDNQWMLVEVGREIIVNKVGGRLKRIAVRVSRRKDFRRRLGLVAAHRLLMTYTVTPGYPLSVLPPRPRSNV